jgi:hypothetical protein
VQKKYLKSWRFLPCLYCGVDSGPVIRFFIFFVGAGVLGSFCWLIWAWATHKLRDDDEISSFPITVEEGNDFDGKSR